MYIVLYRFKVKETLAEAFVKGWKGLTSHIYKYEGSLGSRLHKKGPLEYMAYAQWPEKAIFENAGKNLSKEALKFRDLMKSACEEIKILDEFEVVEDLLEKKTYEA
ncbi:antibiotic biosynthesis monooxygenase family protein [Cognatitamlana onchidii]|uniref:antibiotic biosynthesis monooxygenase family protein n=1 Tax=Cognatitamlana onchidii TaxID=2562860 RepID=UPI0010A5E1AB|nr:antibiotic biosynthesis monooxygenase [Algibacter onchidii]